MHTRQIYCKTPSKFQNVSWMNQTLSGQPMPQTSVLSFTIKWVQSRTYFWGSFKWWNELIQCLIHGKHSMCVLVTQSCPTLQPHGNPPGSSVHGDYPGKNTGVGCCSLLQRIFLTQGSNPILPHCRQVVCCLNHQGSPQALDNISLLLLLLFLV